MVAITDLLKNVTPSVELQARFRDLLSKLAIELPDYCFQCMKCTSGCTAFRLLEIKPHEFVNLARMGFVEELMKSELLWTCAQCLKCKERCPQKAPPVDVIFLLRCMAVGSGMELPEDFSKMIMSVVDTGFIQEPQKIRVGDESLDREKLGLSPISLPDLQKFGTILMKAMEGKV